MIFTIIYPSAAEFWMHYPYGDEFAYTYEEPNVTSLPDSFTTEFSTSRSATIEVANALHLSLPLSLACPEQKYQQRNSIFTSKMRKISYPDNSFFYLSFENHDIYILRPEAVFLDAARSISMGRLIQLGNDLCAGYRIDERLSSGQEERIPITTQEMIAAYLATIEKHRAVAIATQAVKYVTDKSNSPMESKLAAIFAMDKRLGGYGVPRFTLNETITLSDKAQNLFDRKTQRGDFLWEKQHFILEYNSHAFHATRSAQKEDADRQHAFRLSGFTSLSMTADHTVSLSNFDDFVCVLFSELNARLNKKGLENNKSKREAVYNELFKSAADWQKIHDFS